MWISACKREMTPRALCLQRRFYLPLSSSVLFLLLLYNWPWKCWPSPNPVLNGTLLSALIDSGRDSEIFSTCSKQADRRGFHQNVIAYSIYGDFSRSSVIQRYVQPLRETARLLPRVYPGWVMRIYHNISAHDGASLKMLENLFDGRDEYVDLCNATRIIEERNLGDIFSMTWRFMPLLDNMVDRIMSRDCDSPVLPREIDAVSQWLDSDKIFHVIRDHPNHCVAMLGGLWGAKIYRQRSKIVKAAEKMLRIDHTHRIGYDQSLLRLLLWPTAKHSLMSHDSYCCSRYKSTLPHPNQRAGKTFVGMVSSWNDTIVSECPMNCRPENGQDWKYC